MDCAGFFGSQEWAGFGQFRVLTGLLLPSRVGGCHWQARSWNLACGLFLASEDSTTPAD